MLILVTYITQPTKRKIIIHKFWDYSNVDHIFNDGEIIKEICKYKGTKGELKSYKRNMKCPTIWVK
jgi:hypothetical protein